MTGRADLDDAEWDTAVAALGGHPLQSAHWGRAREQVDGRPYVSVAVFLDDDVTWLARAEVRKVPVLGKVAWIPRGPVLAAAGRAAAELGMHELSREGFALCVCTPWRSVAGRAGVPSTPRTIWIDLTKGRDSLWAGLQKKWRHGVGYAQRAGVKVTETRCAERVAEFFGLCRVVSETKGFSLPASEPLLRRLLASPGDAPVSSHLFIATCDQRLAAGAFIIRCGRHIHYFWGATDRELAKMRPGEALHWTVIEWAVSQGCTLYDLEGIDPTGNAGTYEFKRKMGGEEVSLPGIEMHPLDWRGRLIAPVLPGFLRL